MPVSDRYRGVREQRNQGQANILSVQAVISAGTEIQLWEVLQKRSFTHVWYSFYRGYFRGAKLIAEAMKVEFEK